MGALTLPNRVLMAPLTRCRAGEGLAPTSLNAEYYRQRASAGLIISEATQISNEGIGYPHTPGIHTPAQIAGWRLVTQAVHRAGGRIFCQLWHVGRVSHPSFQPGGGLPVSASAINPGGEARTLTGKFPRVTPRALELSEIPRVMSEYRHAAQCALDAGFDGVELHGANTYLPDQFLRDASNTRTDAYGGPIQNRARFMLEALEALVQVWGAGRVGIRLSPSGVSDTMFDSDPHATFGYLVQRLNDYPLAYAHIMRGWRGSGAVTTPELNIPMSFFRPLYRGVLISNAGFTGEEADAMIREGTIDAVAFGVPFIANPDLPERLRRRAPLNAADPATFYGPGEAGYTDYPALAGV